MRHKKPSRDNAPLSKKASSNGKNQQKKKEHTATTFLPSPPQFQEPSSILSPLPPKPAPVQKLPFTETPLPKIPPPKSIISFNPLLIEQYIDKHEKKAVTIEQSHKYLWMHSAWLMTQALRLHTDDTPLQLPAHPVYIELEQPRQIHEHEVAAFSFLQNDQPSWTLSVINTKGETLWSVFHEAGDWNGFPERIWLWQCLKGNRYAEHTSSSGAMS